MEPISPPPTKKRKSDKNDKPSPGSLSPVSQEDYAAIQSKPKKVRIVISSLIFIAGADNF